MSTIRFVLLTALLLSLFSCRPAPSTGRVKGLIAEANILLQEDGRVADNWLGEWGRMFTPQNRAQFPSNRESLRSRGENLIRHLNESTRLNAEAAEKLEQAAGLVTGDKEKKGLTAFAASIRKTVEINSLMKDQMLLASDVEIKDQKTFNEKFMTLMSLIQQKTREKDDQQSEGKALLGW